MPVQRPRTARPVAPPPPDSVIPDLDLDSLTMDFDDGGTTITQPAGALGRDDTMRLDLREPTPSELGPLTEPGRPPQDDLSGDPLARKLELAEEFRQIGDMEGARDLLEEVVAKAGGALRARAQAMLDALT
jgi:pilus assembly protein FimV